VTIRIFLRDGPVASMTRLRTGSRNRSRSRTLINVASETTPASLTSGENRLPFDPASLPTIESIGTESNIRFPRNRGG